MAALFGFIEEPHDKLKQGPSLYQTSSLQNSDSSELKPENTFKIIVLKYLNLHFFFNSQFVICSGIVS